MNYVAVSCVLIALGSAFWVRHLLSSAWQRGFKEGFHQGLQQKIVKVQKTQ